MLYNTREDYITNNVKCESKGDRWIVLCPPPVAAMMCFILLFSVKILFLFLILISSDSAFTALVTFSDAAFFLFCSLHPHSVNWTAVSGWLPAHQKVGYQDFCSRKFSILLTLPILHLGALPDARHSLFSQTTWHSLVCSRGNRLAH